MYIGLTSFEYFIAPIIMYRSWVFFLLLAINVKKKKKLHIAGFVCMYITFWKLPDFFSLLSTDLIPCVCMCVCVCVHACVC